MRTVVITDDGKSRAQLPWPTYGPTALSLRGLRNAEVILLAPKTPRSRFARKVLMFRWLGLISPRVVLSVTYHGMKFHPTGRHSTPFHSACDGWITYSSQDVLRAQSDRVHFIPLPVASRDSIGGGVADRVFVGGRQNREFKIVWEALNELKIPSLFVSDLLPSDYTSRPGIEVVNERIPKKDYVREMARSSLVVVGLEDANRPHGQTDAALAVRHGVPLLVTGGQSCDDYVVEGVNGFLVKNTPEAWRRALRLAWDAREELRKKSEEVSYLTSPDYFAGKLSCLIAELVAPSS